jgi:DNA-directed RNA polymerase specialized sigma24 family protein
MDDWTPDRVAARFDEAAETARRLPPAKVQGYLNVWPILLRMAPEHRPDEEERRFPPSPAAVDRMLETMRWMQMLDVESRHIVWMRADHFEWSQIAKRFGCAVRTVQRRRNIALSTLAENLNGVRVVAASCKVVSNHAEM